MIKKILALALAVTVAFGLVACGNSKKEEKKAPQETVTVDPDAETTTARYEAKGDEIEVEYGFVKLADIKDVIVYSDDVDVTEKAYKESVQSILSQSATTESVEKGTVKKNSAVVVDYTGQIKLNGKKVTFEGGTAQDQTINLKTDSGNYIDGFTSCLAGHKVGDKFTEKLQFPKKYEGTTNIDDKEIKLAGKDVWFTFTIKSLQVTKTPKLDDKFVTEKFGAFGVKTVADFKEYAYKQMRIANITNATWTDYTNSCQVISYNANVKKEQIKKYNENAKTQIQTSNGCSFEDYLEACSMSQEQWDENVEKSVLENMKTQIILQAFAKVYGIEITDAVYKAEGATLAESMTAKLEDLEEQYGKEEVEAAILYQKVQEYFSDNVTVKKGKNPEEETESATK